MALFFNLCLFIVSNNCLSQANAIEPWTNEQLMSPADLAKIINEPGAKKPIIYCIGPSSLIKNSIKIGPGKEKESLKNLKQELSKIQKNMDIVLYCGCCPFANCPNIRPAFSLLNEMKFTNHKLLNLATNIKVDWINKGYPQND